MFKLIAENFIRNIKTLRVYVDSVEPMLRKKIDDMNKPDITSLIKTVVKFKKAGLDIEEFNNSATLPEKTKQAILDIYQLIEVIEADGETAISYSNFPPKIREGVYRFESIENQNLILYSGSLMILITYFDNLFEQIFKEDFGRHPERISMESKSIPYKYLVGFNDIKEAKNHIIEEEITNLMYKSFEERIDYIKKNYKIKANFIEENKEFLNEIVNRRNLFTHNNGVVNSLYLSKVDKKYYKPKGTKLEIKREYINEALDIIEESGISILLEIWLNESEKSEAEISEICDFIYYNYYEYEKWKFSIVCYDILLSSKKLKNDIILRSKLNRGLCYKELCQYEKIKSEIEGLDLSGYQIQYKLGKLALEDKYDEFVELYSSQDEVDEILIDMWPIFKNVRHSETYQNYISNK